MSDDDEKWFTVVGKERQLVVDNHKFHKIELKRISPDEMLKSRSRTRKRHPKKNIYFMRDEQTVLSDVDMEYQMMNSAQTLNDKSSALVKKNSKITVGFDKLLRTPERTLTSQLNHYYTRNLKSTDYNDDMVISYKDLEKDVAKLIEIRKRKSNAQHSMQTENHNESHLMTIGEVRARSAKRAKPSPELKTKKPNDSLLKSIDSNFRPSIYLSTRTYSKIKQTVDSDKEVCT